MTEVTACFLVRDGRIHLAMKKRGFGAGRWNGYGGKSKDGESVIANAIRETQEEANITLHPESLEEAAVIEFRFTEKPEWNQRLHAYLVRAWEGEPQETEEMRPASFPLDGVPYAEMWPEDKLWLSRILLGEKLRGTITFRDLEGNAETVELGNVDRKSVV